MRTKVRHTPNTYLLRHLRRDAVDRYEDHRNSTQTIKRLEKCIELMGPDKSVENLRVADIRKLTKSLQKLEGRSEGTQACNKTVNRYLAALQGALSYAVQNEYIERMPHIAKLDELPSPIHYLNEENEARLLAYVEEHEAPEIQVLIKVLLATGMRVGEILSLKPEQIQGRWIKLRAVDTKGKRDRDVPISLPLGASLAAVCASGWLSYPKVRDAFQRAREALGMPWLTPHKLRHTTATKLTKLNVPTVVVQKFLGHSNIRTTLQYAHVEDDSLQRASEQLTGEAA
jgi:integrase